MITGFKHRALKRFFETGSTRGLPAEQIPKIRLILARLNASVSAKDMNLPGLYLHELTGKRKGTWSVRVSGNWRITFQFESPDAFDINLEDYH
ncbi:MAG: proteic killer suppression protein [Candidatus Azotimanducaceae bacterium]|jgi:proteic killer suppression protein